MTSYDGSMRLGDIRAEHVLDAIAVLDDPVEGPRLLLQLHFKPARDYRLLHEGKFYDSKAVVGIAHGLSPAGEYLTGRTPGFSGGASGAAPVLTRLGFYVDYKWLFEISKLRVDRTHGRPAAYQYVVLLWAIARTRAGMPRMANFNDVRNELAELLAPFALAQTPPDPFMPWLALSNSPKLWEGDTSEYHGWEGGWLEGRSPSAADIRSFNLSGGLSAEFHRDLGSPYTPVQGDQFVEALVDFIPTRLGDEPGYLPLIEKLGLTDRMSEIAKPNDAPEVIDALAAVEELSSPRRKFGRSFTPAENRAIEQCAVAIVREHFEGEGYETKDVGATESYDVHATRGLDVIKIEVKGTTTDGAAVVLTRNEVKLHRVEHPKNALAVVRRITLDRSGDEPVARGGELVLTMPWEIDLAALSPIAYDYRTGL